MWANIRSLIIRAETLKQQIEEHKHWCIHDFNQKDEYDKAVKVLDDLIEFLNQFMMKNAI